MVYNDTSVAMEDGINQDYYCSSSTNSSPPRINNIRKLESPENSNFSPDKMVIKDNHQAADEAAAVIKKARVSVRARSEAPMVILLLYIYI